MSIPTAHATGNLVDLVGWFAAEQTSQPKAAKQQRHMLHCNRPTKNAAAASAAQIPAAAKPLLPNQPGRQHDIQQQQLEVSNNDVIPAIHFGADDVSLPSYVDSAAEPHGNMPESSCCTGGSDSPHSAGVRDVRPAASQQRPQSAMRVVIDVHASFDQNGKGAPIRFHGHKESISAASHNGFTTSHIFASKEPTAAARNNTAGRDIEIAQRPSDQRPLPIGKQSNQRGKAQAKHLGTSATAYQTASSFGSPGDPGNETYSNKTYSNRTYSNDRPDSLAHDRQLEAHRPSSASRQLQAALDRKGSPGQHREVLCITSSCCCRVFYPYEVLESIV